MGRPHLTLADIVAKIVFEQPLVSKFSVRKIAGCVDGAVAWFVVAESGIYEVVELFCLCF